MAIEKLMVFHLVKAFHALFTISFGFGVVPAETSPNLTSISLNVISY
jgi:hypothetical protein